MKKSFYAAFFILCFSVNTFAASGKVDCLLSIYNGLHKVTVSEDAADELFSFDGVAVRIFTKLPEKPMTKKLFTKVSLSVYPDFPEVGNTLTFSAMVFDQLVGYDEENVLINLKQADPSIDPYERKSIEIRCIRQQ